MKEVTIKELEELANQFQEQGKRWHFHMITPDCGLNKWRRDKHIFILENTTDKQAYAVYSDKRYMRAGKRIAELELSNEKEPVKKGGEPVSANHAIMQTIIRKACELNEKNITWHYHRLAPDCILNRHPGKWLIVFEDKEENTIIQALYDAKPVDDLRRIEKLYFQQKK